MNATIGVYDDHDKAVLAVKELKDAGYQIKNLSIIGKTDVGAPETEYVDKDMHFVPKDSVSIKGIGAGTAIGTTLGILTGVGLFAIPGLGFLYGAGALVGAIAGFDFGLLGGGLASVLATVGVKDENVKKYEAELNAGKFLLVAQGSEEEVKQANDILHTHGTHDDMSIH